MTTENTAQTPDAEQNQQAFALQRVYLKDVSLEMPNAPHIFLEQEAPNVEIALNVGGQRLAETVFESTVRVTITTKIAEQVVYLLEATQAGIFEIANFDDGQLDPLLGIVCPSMLFPYLRANVADIINRTSLPPLHLAEVNFQTLYEQNIQAAQQETKQ
ncbi:preprotein translocase subunit SecB [Pelistega indica]|uniref:Protein-export protein SecB n=1 Tax=Pelistega indica TaxID=1414851 RepID=V8FUE6_9BURK|nr:protein-export chaperone SecB [Pelistega indica]ETD67032.1 preprotein translocase subunit SecB [Pelistega indica]